MQRAWLAIATFITVICWAAVQSPCAGEQDLGRGPAPAAGGATGTYKALVIGIDDYQDQSIPALKTAANDARAMAKVLEQDFGFQVQLLLDQQATRDGIYESLRKLVADSSPSDSILIYYAGHGDQDKLLNSGWWLPADAKAGKATTYLGNETVQKMVGAMRARHVLLISDSCYSGTLFGEERERSLPPVIDDKYYQMVNQDTSRWGLTSGNKQPVADGGEEGHSLFAFQLLKELGRPDKPYLTTLELCTRIAPIIANNSEQTPICRPIRNVGDRGGQFVFVRLAAVSQEERPATEPAVNPPDTGKLRVETKPTEAEVKVEGVLYGKAPLDLSDLPAGVVTVTASKPGYREKSEKVKVAAGKELGVELQLDPETGGALVISTEPPEAQIYVDGMSEGDGEVRVTGLKQGMHEVRLILKGYDERQEMVKVALGEEKRVRYVLTKIEDKPAAALFSPAPEPGHGFTDQTSGMEFVWVEGGCYQMGCSSWWPTECLEDEKPRHEACVDGFWMGKFEVTQGEWQKVMEGNPSNFKRGDRYPVEGVSWDEVQEFLRELASKSGRGYRLPTEAEWEFAARSGGREEKYAGGNDLPSLGWYNKNSGQGTHPVGTKAPNGLGLYDMSGNVQEWCADWYDKDYYGKTPHPDPAGPASPPATGMIRVVRGGSWNSPPRDARTARRIGSLPDNRNAGLGFRVILPQAGK